MYLHDLFLELSARLVIDHLSQEMPATDTGYVLNVRMDLSF